VAKKYCSHSALKNENAVFLVFGFVLAQLQGFAKLRLRQSPKILAPNCLQYFFNRSNAFQGKFFCVPAPDAWQGMPRTPILVA
jgi:hypothetical protein